MNYVLIENKVGVHEQTLCLSLYSFLEILHVIIFIILPDPKKVADAAVNFRWENFAWRSSVNEHANSHFR